MRIVNGRRRETVLRIATSTTSIVESGRRRTTGFSDENPETTPDPRQAQHDTTKRYATPFPLEYLAHKSKFGRSLRSSDNGSVALIARPK